MAERAFSSVSDNRGCCQNAVVRSVSSREHAKMFQNGQKRRFALRKNSVKPVESAQSDHGNTFHNCTCHAHVLYDDAHIWIYAFVNICACPYMRKYGHSHLWIYAHRCNVCAYMVMRMHIVGGVDICAYMVMIIYGYIRTWAYMRMRINEQYCE